MPPRELPGFYYDESKQKYFRIQSNHQAPLVGSSGSTSPYTVDSVKRRKVKDDAQKAEAERVHLNRRNIKRATILQDNLLGGLLSREFGRCTLRANREKLVSEHLITRWEASEVLDSEGIDISEFGRANRSPMSMMAFEWDPYTHGLFYCASNGRLMGVDEGDAHAGDHFFEYPRSQRLPRGPLEGKHPYYRRRNQGLLSINNDVSTSINLEPTSRLLLATWMAPRTGHNFHLRKFYGSDPLDRGFQDSIINFRIDSPTHPGRFTSLWTSSPAPESSRYAFAIGATHGIFVIPKDIHSRPSWLRMNTPSTPTLDVFSLAFLSQNPSLLCAAMRSGQIDVLDLRMDLTDYRSGHVGIQHITTACHIKQIDENRLLVAGLESTLAEYDLRYCKARINSPQEVARRFYDSKSFVRRPQQHGRRRVPSPQPWRSQSPQDTEKGTDGFTAPLHVYRGYTNDANRCLAFDFDRESGLVAAAQDDDAGTVKIWSCRTGREVSGGVVDATFVGSSVDKGPVKALRFVADREDRAVKSLWIAKGSKIVRFGC